MAVSTVISGAIGIVGAWGAFSAATGGRVGRWVDRFFLASMVSAIAMPLILHAAAWEATAGKFGWLPLTQTGSRTSALGAYGAFSGLIAAAWIHGLVGASIVGLATWYGTRRASGSIVDQASLDGGALRTWWRCRLPLAMPWVITSLLGAAALAATEMTIVDLYGYRTVADEFYLFHAKNATVAAVLVSCYLPIAASCYFLLTLLVWRRRLVSGGGNRVAPPAERLSGPLYFLALAVAILVSLLIVLVPIAGLVVKAGHQIMVEDGVRTTSWSLNQCFQTLASAPSTFGREYQWTLMLGLMAGACSLVVAWGPAMISRSRPRLGQLFDLVTILMVLIPGPIVGLAVVRLFQWDVPGFRVLYQQTLIPTVMAVMFRAGPVAYWILRAGYRGLDDDLWERARIELSPWRRFFTVDLRLLLRTAFAAFLGSAIVASGDVPALLSVTPPGVTTVGTRLFELLHNGARYQEAALTLWYVAAVVLLAMVSLRGTKSSW